jgi:catechol 2,3-dioxygenase-like lactoylglutathione lyase family enzyme
MFDHVMIRASDGEASERFYETVLGAIGIAKTRSTGDLGEGCPEFAGWGDFALARSDAPTRGLHIGFCAWSHDEVDTFWRTGVEAGYRSDGEPGMRTQYGDDYYGGFLLDPDGNSAEAVYHGGMVRGSNVDHLWIRVADLEACSAFYDRISPYSGFQLRSRPPGRVHFAGSGSTFALVDDDRPMTENLHLAFAADSNEPVDAFHAAATAAGYADNGKPGERPQYHEGYYAAFVRDPAGANVELVNHNR